jgi:hypothetical protein
MLPASAATASLFQSLQYIQGFLLSARAMIRVCETSDQDMPEDCCSVALLLLWLHDAAG